MRTLLIDNYDSFTFNLAQYLGEINEEPPRVIKNDEVNWSTVRSWNVDNIVISPGPGRPDRATDIGIAADILQSATMPILGVCLGHQGICHFNGGLVDLAPYPMHGRISEVLHSGEDIFAGLPSPFNVVRYHSLAAVHLGPMLQAMAHTRDGVVMALRHRFRPMWGVQFHPESICTEHGHRLLRNFRDLTLVSRPRRSWQVTVPQHSVAAECPEGSLNLYWRRIPEHSDPEMVFITLFARSQPSYWLDNSELKADRKRFCYMGDLNGPLAHVVSYRVAEKRIRITHGFSVTTINDCLYSYMNRQLSAQRMSDAGLPCEFQGGYVGYLGYGMKAASGSPNLSPSSTPDAVFLFSDRVVVVDRHDNCLYLLALDERSQGPSRAIAWFDEVERALAAAKAHRELPMPQPIRGRVRLRHAPQRYLELIQACQEEIRQGESYEICLTNQLYLDGSVDPFEGYRRLRRINPAPHAAFLRLQDFAILCSSPERFLRIDHARVIEAKPIKGTTKRSELPEHDARAFDALRNSEKDRAENLMIVDLLRNDLGSVCKIGSVTVDKLFDIESYATVHQMVSTIRGQLRSDVSSIDAVRAAFPGGSMTGAPKLRTMEILERLESGPRGVYSGALGFLALNGCVDLNIVIRTAIVIPGEISIGVGGAIIALSQAACEFEETLVKGEPLIKSFCANYEDLVEQLRHPAAEMLINGRSH